MGVLKQIRVLIFREVSEHLLPKTLPVAVSSIAVRTAFKSGYLAPYRGQRYHLETRDAYVPLNPMTRLAACDDLPHSHSGISQLNTQVQKMENSSDTPTSTQNASTASNSQSYTRVKKDIAWEIQKSLNEVKERRENQASFGSSNPTELDNEFDDGGRGTSNASNRNKRMRPEIGMKRYVPSGTTAGSQPSIKLQPWVDAIASVGFRYKVPTNHKLRVNLLANAKKEVQLLIDSLRSCWEKYGCTIMGDGWKDNKQRPLINFLVYCPRGISFIKSVDASNIVCDAATLSSLFCEIMEIVGPKNVVHMVTDNASYYKAAGVLLSEKYPIISWSPYTARCLNLILKDIAKFPNVATLAQHASRVTVFVYNHKWTLG
ncbi:uncharacterized protein LOC120014195 [Tripterygium wilfordii]|uniref:uncharacterized protein LOC120014195 n=1 Tax=Tripterygium wilfordii TaxID=458696 RepID=UPI0018F80F97|nr:uncharacterized protein LOC120014195 [Tripterygium wilfordii]